uniref:Uncharacterized protein n=1 Tax=Trichobilharzia regenti TaxID=157069 RepID=A0AA85K8C6_TRIRE|nr:unnamed protein product [Trichobilharzia regenti]
MLTPDLQVAWSRMMSQIDHSVHPNRFRPNITVDSVDVPAGRSSMYDFSEDGVDELTHITSMSFGNPSSPKHFQSTEASPYDTSLWLEGNFDKMCNLSVDTEWSPQIPPTRILHPSEPPIIFHNHHYHRLTAL